MIQDTMSSDDTRRSVSPLEEELGAGPGKARTFKRFRERRKCRFCEERIDVPDYKDVATLQKLQSAQAKVYSRKRTGCCARHQRLSKVAIKRARYVSLLPYIS
jgi:small subunit ribosomal protein S18